MNDKKKIKRDKLTVKRAGVLAKLAHRIKCSDKYRGITEMETGIQSRLAAKAARMEVRIAQLGG